MDRSDNFLDRVCGEVDAAGMMAHLVEFAKRVKLSGTPPELESFEYLKRTIEIYGFRVRLTSHPGFVSVPGRALLEVDGLEPRCITHSMARPSPVGGLSGEVVYIGNGSQADFAAHDVSGKIVLVDGIATPPVALRASRAGAIGQIHVSPHEHLHEMCISPVWGSPSVEALDRLPTTVVISIPKSDGDAIKAKLQSAGPIVARMVAEVDTGWRQLPLIEAELFPEDAGDEAPFVMLCGHHDTWHLGVMDNGGANATMLEVARLVAKERHRLRRGLRLCFWSGHSHGRFAGSTWYADNHWTELADRCVAHVYADSTGARGNTVLADAQTSAELFGLGREAVAVRGAQELDRNRMGRAGDQSFWGIGIPSLFLTMGEQPAGSQAELAPGLFGNGRKGAGYGWWWHTPDDTLDKMDVDILVRDTRIYAHAIFRLLTDKTLPIDIAAQVAAIRGIFETVARSVGERLDTSEVLNAFERLSRALLSFQSECGGLEDTDLILMMCSRALVPIDYSSGDRFSHDPALPQQPLPVLDPLRSLAAATGEDEIAHCAVSARRACNRIVQALLEASRALGAR